MTAFRAARDAGADVAALRAAIAAASTRADSSGSPRSALRDASAGAAALGRWIDGRNRTDYIDALAAFKEALREAPDLAAAYYGLGLCHALGPELAIPGATGYLHRRAYVATNAELLARRALLHAVMLDPTLDDAALEIAAIALATRNDSTLIVADSALALTFESGDDGGRVSLAQSDIALARGRPAVAESLARRALEHGAGASAHHALGRAILCAGARGSGRAASGRLRSDAESRPRRADSRDRDGALEYLAGLERTDAQALARYYDDARFLFARADFERWMALPDSAKATWLRRFWERSAAASVRTVPERLSIHIRRLSEAHARYRRSSFRGARPAGTLDVDTVDTDVPFDARGVIYIRHGPPDRIIRTAPDPAGRLVPPNQTWVYDRGGQPLVLHFLKLPGRSDWQLTPGVPCDPLLALTGDATGGDARRAQELPGILGARTGGAAAAGNLSSFVRDAMRPYLDWAEARYAVDPSLSGRTMRCLNLARRFAQGAAAGDDATSALLADLDAERREFLVHETELADVADRLISTENALPAFTNPLETITALYTFRGAAGRTDIAATVLVPAAQFTPTSVQGGVRYALDATFALTDPATGRTIRADSNFTQRAPRRMADGRYLRFVLRLGSAPADSATLHVAVRNRDNPDEGSVQAGWRTVPDYSGKDLMLSDIVIAEDRDGPWHRGGNSLAPIPTNQIDAGSAFRLYYEIYNLVAGDAYETRIRIEPRDRSLLDRIGSLFGGKRPIDLRFEDVAGPPSAAVGQPQMRTILGQLEPGSYTMKVTVRSRRTGDEVTRETSLNVNG